MEFLPVKFHGRIKGIDMPQLNFIIFLRAFAAILVLLCHTWIMFWYSGGQVGMVFSYLKTIDVPSGLHLINITQYLDILHLNFGRLGVALFYLITGFLAGISISYQTTGTYLFKRFIRIFPLYAVGFTVTFFCIYLYTKFTNQNFSYGFKDWLIQVSLLREFFWMQSIDGISWTLEAQTKFYIIVAVLIMLKKTHSAKVIIIIAIFLTFLCILSNINAARIEKYVYLYRFAIILKLASLSIVYMLLGLAIYQHHCKCWSSTKTILAVYILYVCFILCSVTYDPVSAFDHVLNYSIILIFFVILYNYSRTDYTNLFSSKPIKFIADISYPLFIVHGLIGYIIMTALRQVWGGTPFQILCISIIISILLAWMLHRYIETPLTNFSKVISKKFFL